MSPDPTTSPTPAPATPPSAPPVGTVALGVTPDQVKTISATWRREGDEIGKMPWSAMTEATGEGSDVLALVRGMADPAQQAMTSIATRFTTLADLLDKYSANIQDKDTEIATEIGKLSPR